MAITLDGTTGITTPEITSAGGPLVVNASAPDSSVVVDASGNVGIGVTPSSVLHVKSAAPIFRLETTGTVSAGGTAYSVIKDSTGSDIFYSGFAGLPNCYQFGTTAAAGFIRFLTGAQAEAARIDASGNLLVNRTGPDGPAVFQVATKSDYGIGVASGVSTTQYVMEFRNSNGVVGTITTSGSATAYNTSSDYRLKENVVPLSGAADRLMQIPVCRFNFIADPDTTVDGFLAHEAQAVVPECVTGTKDAMRDEEYEVTAAVLDADGMVVTEAVMGTRSVPDYQGIDQSKLVPLLTAALQEALTKIASMETRLAALEAV